MTIANKLEKAGVDALLAVTGYYNRPNQEGLLAHYRAMDAAVSVPIIVYNVPARTSCDIAVATVNELSKLDNIIGIKDATGDLARVALHRVGCAPDFLQISGEDMTAVGYNAMGGEGCISVSANVAPQLCAQLQEACANSDWATALELQDRLAPLHDAMFSDISPGPAKYALSLLGLCSADLRLPLVPPSEAAKAQVQAALAWSWPYRIMSAAKAGTGGKTIAENRRARHDYTIEDVIEAGLILQGTEVKALREGKVTIAESYASPEAGGIWLINANIPEYSAGNRENHEPKRPRQLLLHKREIVRLSQAVERKGYTLVPLRLYFNARGMAKLALGLALGKKHHDKRETTKKRDWSRDKQRLLKNNS